MVFIRFHSQVFGFEATVPCTIMLIHRSQYNSEKQNIEKKKIEYVDKKKRDTSGLVKKADFYIKKLQKLRIKYLILMV